MSRQALFVLFGQLRRGDNNAIHPAAVEGLDHRHLAVGVVVRDTLRKRLRFSRWAISSMPRTTRPTKGSAMVVTTRPMVLGALPAQALRDRVRDIAHFVGQFLDLFAHLGADQRAVPQGARDGGMGNARLPGQYPGSISNASSFGASPFLSLPCPMKIPDPQDHAHVNIIDLISTLVNNYFRP